MTDSFDIDIIALPAVQRTCRGMMSIGVAFVGGASCVVAGSDHRLVETDLAADLQRAKLVAPAYSRPPVAGSLRV